MDNNSGELVKKYRSLLKISQKEAAGTRMSHSMVSLIESGKIQMTTVTAMILADNFNRIAASKGLDLNLSLKDLFSTRSSSIEIELRNALDEVVGCNCDEGKYEDVFCRAKENNCFELMAEIKKHQGELAERREDYNKAIEQYKKAYDLFKLTGNNKGSAEMIVELAKCHNRLKEHRIAEEYLEKIRNEITSKCQDEHILFQANLELLITMVNTNRNNDALKVIDTIIKSKKLNNVQRKEILMIKSCIFIDEGRLGDAVSILKKMITSNLCSDYLTYHKLAIANILLGQKQEEIFYVSQCINTLSSNVNPENTKTAIRLAEEFGHYNISIDAVKYYDFALANSQLFHQEDYKYKCYKSIFQIYEKYTLLGNYERYLKDIKKIIVEGNVDNLTNYIILIVKYYLQMAKIDELKFTIDQLSEKY